MKRYVFLIVAAGLWMACSKDDEVTGDKEPVGIEIRYSRAGETISDLSLGAGGAEIVVDVELNNDKLYWNIVSDAPWCTVVEEEHRGNGSFTLDISANDSFESREPAVLMFRSGQYSRKAFQVSQSGNIFIIEEAYMVRSKDSGSTGINISVKEGNEWDFSCDSWMQVTKKEGGLNVSWEENPSQDSRMGIIKLFRAGESEAESQISLCQLGTGTGAGTEYGYADGAVILPAEGESEPAFEILAPASYIEGMELPEWLSCTTSNDETVNVVKYSFFTEDNPSDTKSVREHEIELSVIGSDVKVKVPLIRQDYYPVSGIITAGGLKMFAETANAGGDVSDWMKDGVVVMLNSIDMKTLDGVWVPVGSEEKPFEGTFDGGSFEIMNFESSAPIFGFCREATISNLTINETSVFTVNAGNGGRPFGTLAGSVEGGTILNCHSNAGIKASGTISAPLLLGGLVGQLNAGTDSGDDSEPGLDGCSFGGKITSDATPAGTEEICIGGVLSIANGDISNCVCTSSSLISSNKGIGASRVYMGGIAAKVWEGCNVENCSSQGELSVVDTEIRNTRYYLGGIAGKNEKGIISGSNSTGSIKADTYREYVNAGGIAGWNQGPVTDSGNAGTIEISNYPTTTYIGGICGINEAKVVDRVSSSGKLVRTDTANYGDHAVGGLIGFNEYAITGQPAMTHTGEIDLSAWAGKTSLNLYVGGIVGTTKEAFDYTNFVNESPVPEKEGWQRGDLVGGPDPVNSPEN